MHYSWATCKKLFISKGRKRALLFFVGVSILFFGLYLSPGISFRGVEASEIQESSTGRSFNVKDATGREVSFERIPRRIVVIGRAPFMPMNVIYMFPAAGERLVGYEVKFKTTNSFLPLIDPHFQQKIELATNPGPEQIAALHPDLVIMKGTVPEPIEKSLDVLGIPSFYLGLESPALFFKDVENLGIIFGNPDRAGEINRYYRLCLNIIEKGLRELQPEDKPGILVLEYNNRGGKAAVHVPARSWMQTIQTIVAGGRPVWLQDAHSTDGWTVTNFEQIAAWDPDKIFAIIWFILDPAKIIQSLRADPGWRMLRAVRNHELYAFPSDIFGWDSPEPRWILGMLWLAKKIHHDRFSNLDIRTVVYEYFNKMYSLKEGVVTSEIMPSIYLGSE